MRSLALLLAFMASSIMAIVSLQGSTSCEFRVHAASPKDAFEHSTCTRSRLPPARIEEVPGDDDHDGHDGDGTDGIENAVSSILTKPKEIPQSLSDPCMCIKRTCSTGQYEANVNAHLRGKDKSPGWCFTTGNCKNLEQKTTSDCPGNYWAFQSDVIVPGTGNQTLTQKRSKPQLQKSLLHLAKELKKYSYAHMYNLLIGPSTDIRHARYSGALQKGNLGAQSSKCLHRESISTKPCPGSSLGWGYAASTYLCAEDNIYAYKEGQKSGANFHPQMGRQCSAPSGCEATICVRYDTKPQTRTATLMADMKHFGYTKPSLLYSSVSVSVSCGVRQKIMVCPLAKGGITRHCNVYKHCGPPANPQPAALQGRVIWSVTYPKGVPATAGPSYYKTTGREVWRKILNTKQMQQGLKEICAAYCGLF